jgi:hypothetical protein
MLRASYAGWVPYRGILAPFTAIASVNMPNITYMNSIAYRDLELPVRFLKSDNCGYIRGIPVKAGVTYAYEVQRGIYRSSSMANQQGSQQGQGSGSGTGSNQDPSQKSGTGQQQDPSQKGGAGQQGKPNDMNKSGNQPGSGSQQSGGSGSSNR